MPLYDFRCADGHFFERFVPLSEFHEVQQCPCGEPSARLPSIPMISVENVEYTCPVTGDPILSKRAHEENLKRHDCVVAETGTAQAMQADKKRAAAEFERRIDETVEREILTMDGDKRTALAKDLSRSDLQLERTTHG